MSTGPGPVLGRWLCEWMKSVGPNLYIEKAHAKLPTCFSVCFRLVRLCSVRLFRFTSLHCSMTKRIPMRMTEVKVIFHGSDCDLWYLSWVVVSPGSQIALLFRSGFRSDLWACSTMSLLSLLANGWEDRKSRNDYWLLGMGDLSLAAICLMGGCWMLLVLPLYGSRRWFCHRVTVMPIMAEIPNKQKLPRKLRNKAVIIKLRF